MGTIWTYLMTSTGDLDAMQKFIDHANLTIETDFKQLQELSASIKAQRAALDEQMMDFRNQLEPACKQYAEARKSLVTGDPGKPPLSDECEKAQGSMRTLLALGSAVKGCAQGCKWDAKYEQSDFAGWADTETVWCDHGDCAGELRCFRQLEDIIWGPMQAQRDSEILHACNKAGFKMIVEPPMTTGSSAGSNPFHCKGPTPSSMPPALLGMLALVGELRQRSDMLAANGPDVCIDRSMDRSLKLDKAAGRGSEFL